MEGGGGGAYGGGIKNLHTQYTLYFSSFDNEPRDRPMLGVRLKNDSLSVLLPVLGVGAGEASMNGIDSSSYRGDFLQASPLG